MSICPVSADLRRLFTGELDSAASAQMDRHVESCTPCQKHLAKLTESADADRWKQLLASPELAETDAYQVTPPSPEPRVEPLPEIPGYRIIREIGRGGAATVYLARQVSLNRLVALKILRGGVEPGAVQRFRGEAEAAARLRHPNIVVVHEVGEHGGQFYLALEFFDGGTLTEFAGRNPLPPRNAALLLEPVARALHHAHQANVIHRDVKPSNILLQHSGASSGSNGHLAIDEIDIKAMIPKVCDFGLARRLDESIGLTRTRDLLGTPVYMAPELVADSGAAAPTSDIYATGVVLYELLTGRPPFFGNTPLDTLLKARDFEPVAPRRLQPSIPLDLQTICLKCLEKDPARRYATASELADELQRFLTGQPVHARPVSTLALAARWARRHKAFSTLLAMLMVLIVAGTTSALIAANYFRHMAHDMQKLADEKEVERQKTDEQREQTLRTLYFTRASLAGQSLSDIDSSHQVELFLREWRGLKARIEPRGWEWFFLTGLNRQAAQTLHGHELDVMALAWSPDGRRLASAGFGRALHLWDAQSGRQLSMTKAGWGINAIQWSPDGKRIITLGADNLVFEHDGATGEQIQQMLSEKKVRAISTSSQQFAEFIGNDIVVCNRSGQKLHEFKGLTEPPLIAAWSPNDQMIAGTGNSGHLCVWDSSNQSLVRDITTGNEIVALKWSRNGQSIACAHASTKITLWDMAMGRLLREFESGSTQPAKCLDLSPDGKTLAAGMFDSKLKLWDTATGQELVTLAEHQFIVHSVAFCPDGQKLASSNGNWNGQIKLWNVADIRHSHDFATVANRECQVFWDADGQKLVVGDANGYRILDAQNGAVLRTIAGSSLRGTSATADGRRFVGRDANQALAIWDQDGHAQLLPAEVDNAQARRITFSPTGRHVAATSWSDGKPDRFRLRIWNLQTGQCLRDGSGNGGAWSPDGRWFAVGDIYNISLLDTEKFHVFSSWASPDTHNIRLVFSPDIKQLASVYRNNVVVRDLASGTVQFQLVGHNDEVNSVQWSPDGTRIATGANDGTVRIWDSGAGQLILTLRGHNGPVFSVAWSPDGQRLISAGSGAVKNWDARRGYAVEKIGQALPIDPPARSDSPTIFRNAGWWVIDESEWNPDGPDPFSHPRVWPRWFAASDDPNGFLPLANGSVVYLQRVFAATPTTIKLHRPGVIATHLWWNGHCLNDASVNSVALTPGWNTLALRIAEPEKQSDVIARPNGGLYVRFDLP